MPQREGVVCVKGHYLYYHYEQQGTHDKGWGCAYRSLQTLISFFVLNHYYEMRIPTIPEIQEMLVAMSDKPPAFVHSRDWIGSHEVGYVLGYLLDVESKYIILDKGKEIRNHLQKLKEHFVLQGTPVMIGGGVLALTCLGVDWNEKTGQCNLLILDPHYVGDDDVEGLLREKKQMEGYRAMCCEWRSLKDVFKDNVFYSLCLPQRPSVY
ncbi:Ufm1-specific protease [Blastocystis sp. ATCC 50177/Nand II]|nr:Ufm1-specific protease [Blastocystis sp. ATCC 50177/Nand II]